MVQELIGAYVWGTQHLWNVVRYYADRASGRRPSILVETEAADAAELVASAATTAGMTASAIGISEGAGHLAAAPPATATAPPRHGSLLTLDFAINISVQTL